MGVPIRLRQHVERVDQISRSIEDMLLTTQNKASILGKYIRAPPIFRQSLCYMGTASLVVV